MNVLAFETRWAKNKVSDISWYIFIQLSNLKYFNYMCYKHIWKIRPYKTHFLSWNYSASLQYNILSYIYMDSFPISPFTPKLEKQGFIILTLESFEAKRYSAWSCQLHIFLEKNHEATFFSWTKIFISFLETLSGYDLKDLHVVLYINKPCYWQFCLVIFVVFLRRVLG